MALTGSSHAPAIAAMAKKHLQEKLLALLENFKAAAKSEQEDIDREELKGYELAGAYARRDTCSWAARRLNETMRELGL